MKYVLILFPTLTTIFMKIFEHVMMLFLGVSSVHCLLAVRFQYLLYCVLELTQGRAVFTLNSQSRLRIAYLTSM